MEIVCKPLVSLYTCEQISDKLLPKSWGGKAHLAVEDLSNIKTKLSVILKDGQIRTLIESKLFQQ